MKSIFERTINDLTSEESKGSRFEIPESIGRKVAEVQALHRKVFGKKITREQALLLAVVDGIEAIRAKIVEVERTLEAMEH